MEKAMEYILQIFKEKSFSNAAAKLFITQPALSAIVKKEEDAYGVQFFNRSVKPIIPTPEGAKYLRTAEKIQKLEATLKKEFASLHPQNALTIGGAAFFCANIIPILTKTFSARYGEHCPINIIEADAYGLVALLQNNRADFIITVENLNKKKYASVILNREHIILAVPKVFVTHDELRAQALPIKAILDDSYLQTRFPAVNLKDFSDLPYILLPKGNDLYSRARKLFREHAVVPLEITYMDQLQSAFLAAKNGHGAVFIRAELLKFMDGSSDLFFFKFDDPLCWRNVYLCFKQKKKLSAVAKAFLAYCNSTETV